jgi:glycerol-3-phosphate dehydrogenase
MIRMLQEGPGAIRDIIADKEKAVSTTPTKALDAPSPPAVTAEATNATPVPDSEADVFDLLIIGGGATGAGCAVDAATRGLKVAMVERDDFSSGKKIPPPSSLFLGGH